MSALVAILCAATAAPAARRTGSVEYATSQRLYLDAGERDGLAPGQVLHLRHAGRPAGSCKVEAVSAHGASCAGSGTVGSDFDLPAPPAAAPSAQIKRAAPPEPAAAVAQRRAVVEAASFDKVDFHGPPQIAAAPRGIVTVSHASWLSTGAGPWHQERLDASLHDLPVGGPLTLDVDLSARRYSLRSAPVSFRPEDPTQLYVWEAALSRQPRDGGLALSVGRVRTRLTPGQSILDGAQAGFRTSRGNEVGLFGGAVPDEVTLAPSLQHGTFGAYWAGQHEGDRDAALRLFRHEARVAFVNTAALGKRVEGEGLVQLWLTRRFDASADLRVGGGGHRAPGALDGVRLDANLEPVDRVTLSGGFRYEGLSIPELDGAATRFGGAARHADASAQWDAAPFLRVSIVSGLSTDLTTNVTRRWAGPELGVPGLLGGGAVVSAGYLEEQGWATGRSGYLQLIAGQRSRVQVMTRVSWFHTHAGLSPEPTDDLSVFASVRARLSQLFSLRLTAMGRSALDGGGSAFGGASAQSGWLDADLSGEF